MGKKTRLQTPKTGWNDQDLYPEELEDFTEKMIWQMNRYGIRGAFLRVVFSENPETKATDIRFQTFGDKNAKEILSEALRLFSADQKKKIESFEKAGWLKRQWYKLTASHRQKKVEYKKPAIKPIDSKEVPPMPRPTPKGP
jgi:hypothetical protein